MNNGIKNSGKRRDRQRGDVDREITFGDLGRQAEGKGQRRCVTGEESYRSEELGFSWARHLEVDVRFAGMLTNTHVSNCSAPIGRQPARSQQYNRYNFEFLSISFEFLIYICLYIFGRINSFLEFSNSIIFIIS